MAFLKRTWLARIGTGLNKFIIGEKDAQNKQTLVNDPDSITQEGDTISAQNLNDLEDRIETGFNDAHTELVNGLGNAHTELVNGLATKQNTLTFDDAPVDGSSNPVTSGGIYTALTGKQNTLTFDTVPTSGSTNPVTSGGIFNNIGVTKVSFADLDKQSADVNLPNLQLKELCFVNALGSSYSHKIKMPTGGGRYYFLVSCQLDSPNDRIFTFVGEHAGNGDNMVTCYDGTVLLYRYQ